VDDPRIYLVLDNCFAIKRWIRPAHWLKVCRDAGFLYVQASTDNEIDPLFSPNDYMDDWFEELKEAEKSTGAKVINFYTGYQTYRTAGLAHYDKRVRQKLVEDWFKPLIKRIALSGAAGLGFSMFAFSEDVLRDQAAYKERMETVVRLLAELADFAFENGRIDISVEQMYAPHQPPWTIDGTYKLLEDVYAISKNPFYITLDVGHAVGQCRFLKPETEMGETVDGSAKSKKQAGEAPDKLTLYPYMFSEEKDCNPYNWLKELACFSPIIHLQQTDGIISSHKAFSPDNNKDGIIKPAKVLKAIKSSYEKDHKAGLPAKSGNIYLSFEIFASNVEKNNEIIKKLKQSLKYWREHIPEDGLPLSQLV